MANNSHILPGELRRIHSDLRESADSLLEFYMATAEEVSRNFLDGLGFENSEPYEIEKMRIAREAWEEAQRALDTLEATLSRSE